MGSRPQERTPPEDWVRQRMSRQRREGTQPELDLRRVLHARGLRYRLGFKVPGNGRRTIDVAFPKQSLAVFVDGCFWHRCPQHSVPAKRNAEWWAAKLDDNVRRDRSTDALLADAGWRVIRVWEHEDVQLAAGRITRVLAEVNRQLRDPT